MDATRPASPSPSSSSRPQPQPLQLTQNSTPACSSAHTALTNPDILELILENLSIDHVWTLPHDQVVSRRRVLAAVALTCRGFSEPALDRLWRSLDKLFPLFRLLPAFYRSDSTFVLRGTVTEADWARFDSYAYRVKSFSYTRDPDSLDIAMHVYFRIAQLRSHPLLPSLQHLRCPHISQDDFLISSICLFLTPTLHTLDFDKITGVEDKLIGTFLHTLLSEGAQVRGVVLEGEGLTRDTLGYLGRLGASLRRVVVCGMGPQIEVGLVRSLGKLKGLEEVQLDLEGSRLDTVDEPPPYDSSGSVREQGEENELGYRELTKLELVAPLGFIKSFVGRINSTHLRYVSFESSTSTDAHIHSSNHNHHNHHHNPFSASNTSTAHATTASASAAAAAAVAASNAADRKELLTCIVQRWKDTLTYFRMVHLTDEDDDDVVGFIEEDGDGAAPGPGAAATVTGANTLPTMSMEILSPLLKVTALAHLEVDGYGFEVCDGDVGEMARAWPHIRTLHLPFTGSIGAAGATTGGGATGGTTTTRVLHRPTMVSLHTLSKNCPDLRHLTIPLDTTTPPTTITATATANDLPTTTAITTTNRPIKSQHRLETLTVASPDEPWDLRRVMRLARGVDQLFPYLREVKGGVGIVGIGHSDHEERENGGVGGWGRWRQVDEMVKMCQGVRNDALCSTT